AVGDPVDQLGNVVRESLDRHGAAGVGRVAVALELDADHPAAVREPGKDVAEAALEGENAAVQGDQRRSRRIPVLLVPNGDAVDLLVGHADSTIDAGQTHRSCVRSAVRPRPLHAQNAYYTGDLGTSATGSLWAGR